MQNDGVLGDTSLLQMAQGTALEMNGHRQTTWSVNIEDGARVNLDGGHLEITQGGSIAGKLTGSGGLALTGGSLAGDNTAFSGTYSVDADNSLTVSAANQSGEATIENAVRLVLSADDNWQINNQITGAGNLEKYGSGRVFLGAASAAYTGATDIYGGTLVFGERDAPVTLASSQVSIHEGGTLAGNGDMALSH